MKIIKTLGKNKNFIAGIFKNFEDAREYYEQIPNEKKYQFEIINISSNFPFYIIEENNGFEFFNEAQEIRKRLENIISTNDPDEHYFNVYRVLQEFKANKPGNDAMGILEHYHIDYHFLKCNKIEKLIKLLSKGS